MAVVTRLWPYGGPGHPYGSFAGKAEQEIPEPPVVIIEGGDDVPKRRRQAEEALDAVLERAAAGALVELAPEQEIAAVVEQVRQEAQDNPPTREQAEEIGLPLDMAAELATLARIDAAIKDRNQQLREEQDVIIALLLAA